VLFDMKNDIAELKKEMKDLIGGSQSNIENDTSVYYPHEQYNGGYVTINKPIVSQPRQDNDTVRHREIIHSDVIDTGEVEDTNLSLTDSELNLIKKALEKHSGKRKAAAIELGISERTLYRKLKEYNITR